MSNTVKRVSRDVHGVPVTFPSLYSFAHHRTAHTTRGKWSRECKYCVRPKPARARRAARKRLLKRLAV